MPDDEHEHEIPDPRQPPPVQVTQNVGETVSHGGLQGAILRYAQTSIVTLFLILYSWMNWWVISTGREDRQEDRQMFRDSVKQLQDDAAVRVRQMNEDSARRAAEYLRQLQEDSARRVKELQDEQNRRAGEIRGALDVNTSVMRELIAEFKAARTTGTIKPDAPLPKAPPP